MTGAAGFACEPLGPANAPALAELFERAGSSCYCAFWHFTGDKNAWLARLAFDPGENRRELLERAERRQGGVVARLANGTAVGWMSLEPARELAKIYAQRPYRALPAFGSERPGIFTIGCFLIDPAWRRRGVARALLRAGIELARARGARALEAFPRRAQAVGDEALLAGPLALFEAEGFRVVHEQAQYPVLRLDWGQGAVYE